MPYWKINTVIITRTIISRMTRMNIRIKAAIRDGITVMSRGSQKEKKKMPRAVAVVGLALLFGVVSGSRIFDVEIWSEAKCWGLKKIQRVRKRHRKSVERH